MEHMEQEILKKIEAQGEQLDEIQRSVERMQKYFFWTLIITIVVIVLPLLGLALVLPQFLNTYTSSLGL